MEFKLVRTLMENIARNTINGGLNSGLKKSGGTLYPRNPPPPPLRSLISVRRTLVDSKRIIITTQGVFGQNSIYSK